LYFVLYSNYCVLYSFCTETQPPTGLHCGRGRSCERRQGTSLMSRAGATKVTRSSTRRTREEPVSSESEGTESADSDIFETWSVEAVEGEGIKHQEQVRAKRVAIPGKVVEEKTSKMDKGYGSQTPEVLKGSLGGEGDGQSMSQMLQLFMQHSMSEREARREEAARLTE